MLSDSAQFVLVFRHDHHSEQAVEGRVVTFTVTLADRPTVTFKRDVRLGGSHVEGNEVDEVEDPPISFLRVTLARPNQCHPCQTSQASR